jgi:hypothetical protein
VIVMKSLSSGIKRCVVCLVPYLLHACFLLDLFFDPEDGSDLFLWDFD